MFSGALRIRVLRSSPLKGVAVALMIGGVAASPAAQAPSLDQVMARVTAYARDYGPRLSTVVSEERYRQEMDSLPAGSSPSPSQQRTLRSDYVLTRVPATDDWVGYRDTFDMDGRPVREREERLLKILQGGGPRANAEAARIASENARYNLGSSTFVRNINIPTFALDLMHPRYRKQFSFKKAGEEMLSGTRVWRIEYREREFDTIVHRQDGHDQPLRGFLWVDPLSGEVWRTALSWTSGPEGSITVTYGRTPVVDVLVPVRMAERYIDGAFALLGDATYSNYRRFETAGRLLSVESPAPTDPAAD